MDKYMENILDLDLNELSLKLEELNEKPFRAKQIFNFIQNRVYEFDKMSNLPKVLVSKLKENFNIKIPEIVEVLTSKIDETKKVILKLEDENIIECVIMKYKYGYSVCVSSQVGCKMNCSFCASTLGGIVRNLSSGEMIGEILKCEEIIGERISNVVIMGSGEPLDNYDNVLKFIKGINSEYLLNIGERHITLSTCGIVPKIIELSGEKLQITLAISLHEVCDEDRIKIMPIGKIYGINEILRACNHYFKETGRRITFEYVLINNVNDDITKAEKLAMLLKDLNCNVNLIPLNEVEEKDLKRANRKNANKFLEILTKNGIQATIRRELGSDINGACGQLRNKYINTI